MAHSEVQVLVRVRPMLARELAFDSAVETDEENIRVYNDSQQFESNYHKVFSEFSTQEEVYDELKGIVDVVLDGFNSTVFAYGQTGTGKTYTIIGDHGVDVGGDLDAKHYSKLGILPRAVKDIFRGARQKQDREGTVVQIVCSYMEIYNERLYDLLQPYKKGMSRDPLDVNQRRALLEVREDVRGQTFVPNVLCVKVKSYKSVFQLLSKGNQHRAVRHTEMNMNSSRSHAILQLVVEQWPNGGADGTVFRSKLNFVDLAGSERWNTNVDMATERVSEMTSINGSLSALASVVAALTERRAHVPYRVSKLTHLLQDSLGGNCQTVVLATVSPSWDAFEETCATLRFADRARCIDNNPVVNASRDMASVLALKEREIKRLRALLTKYTGGEAGEAGEGDKNLLQDELEATKRALLAERTIREELEQKLKTRRRSKSSTHRPEADSEEDADGEEKDKGEEGEEEEEEGGGRAREKVAVRSSHASGSGGRRPRKGKNNSSKSEKSTPGGLDAGSEPDEMMSQSGSGSESGDEKEDEEEGKLAGANSEDETGRRRAPSKLKRPQQQQRQQRHARKPLSMDLDSDLDSPSNRSSRPASDDRQLVSKAPSGLSRSSSAGSYRLSTPLASVRSGKGGSGSAPGPGGSKRGPWPSLSAGGAKYNAGAKPAGAVPYDHMMNDEAGEPNYAFSREERSRARARQPPPKGVSAFAGQNHLYPPPTYSSPGDGIKSQHLKQQQQLLQAMRQNLAKSQADVRKDLGIPPVRPPRHFSASVAQKSRSVANDPHEEIMAKLNQSYSLFMGAAKSQQAPPASAPIGGPRHASLGGPASRWISSSSSAPEEGGGMSLPSGGRGGPPRSPARVAVLHGSGKGWTGGYGSGGSGQDLPLTTPPSLSAQIQRQQEQLLRYQEKYRKILERNSRASVLEDAATYGLDRRHPESASSSSSPPYGSQAVGTSFPWRALSLDSRESASADTSSHNDLSASRAAYGSTGVGVRGLLSHTHTGAGVGNSGNSGNSCSPGQAEWPASSSTSTSLGQDPVRSREEGEALIQTTAPPIRWGRSALFAATSHPPPPVIVSPPASAPPQLEMERTARGPLAVATGGEGGARSGIPAMGDGLPSPSTTVAGSPTAASGGSLGWGRSSLRLSAAAPAATAGSLFGFGARPSLNDAAYASSVDEASDDAASSDEGQRSAIAARLAATRPQENTSDYVITPSSLAAGGFAGRPKGLRVGVDGGEEEDRGPPSCSSSSIPVETRSASFGLRSIIRSSRGDGLLAAVSNRSSGPSVRILGPTDSDVEGDGETGNGELSDGELTRSPLARYGSGLQASPQRGAREPPILSGRQDGGVVSGGFGGHGATAAELIRNWRLADQMVDAAPSTSTSTQAPGRFGRSSLPRAQRGGNNDDDDDGLNGGLTTDNDDDLQPYSGRRLAGRPAGHVELSAAQGLRRAAGSDSKDRGGRRHSQASSGSSPYRRSGSADLSSSKPGARAGAGMSLNKLDAGSWMFILGSSASSTRARAIAQRLHIDPHMAAEHAAAIPMAGLR